MELGVVVVELGVVVVGVVVVGVVVALPHGPLLLSVRAGLSGATQPLQVPPDPLFGMPWTCAAPLNGPAPPAGVDKKLNELALKVPVPL